ncbi:hypothetical protein ASE77_17395 [Sphingomonas sp. Leaf226]|nr:hypothetical protein ASE77_17395 [Sphingomonas sp. Leaf226]
MGIFCAYCDIAASTTDVLARDTADQLGTRVAIFTDTGLPAEAQAIIIILQDKVDDTCNGI